jgi:flagellar FliL protein
VSTKEKAPETDEAPAKGGKKKLVMIMAVVVLAVAGGAYFFLFSGGSAAADGPVAGAVLPLDPVAVNLAGGGYLKVGVALQLTADVGKELPNGSKATDLVIATFSQAAPRDVTGAREALKQALQAKIIKAYTEKGTQQVMGIYYTQYVTQ